MLKHCPNPECPGLARDGVVAEFRDTVERCVECGTLLASGERPEAPEWAAEYVHLVTVFIAADVSQGHLVAGEIEAAGIPVFLKGEHLVGAVGELPTTVSQVEVQVPTERVDAARQIALRWEGPAAPGPPDRGEESQTDGADELHDLVAAALGQEAEPD